MDSTHPDFDLVGGYSGIGAILYEPIGVAPLPVSSTRTFATPLLPNIKNYPLVDEVVILFYLPNKQINQNSNIKQYYYLNPIAIWNNQHLNAYPNLNVNNFFQSTENKTYQAIEQGQTRKSTEEVVNYNYNSPQIGGSFFERANIHPLFSYAGDVIMEGRWGNSIRFGSTARIQNDIFQNDWSSTGEDGEPITIIRNGQPKDASLTGYLPIVEDNTNEMFPSSNDPTDDQIEKNCSDINVNDITIPVDMPKEENYDNINLIESGLFFRFDATNIVTPAVSIITNLSKEVVSTKQMNSKANKIPSI